MNERSVHGAGTAAVLSFVFSGLGQLYNGQIKKGLLIVFVSSCSIFVFLVGAIFTGMAFLDRVVFAAQLAAGLTLLAAGLTLICVFGIYSIVDAYQTGLKRSC